MESLITLAALLGLVFVVGMPIAVIYLLVSNSRLKGRVAALELRVRRPVGETPDPAQAASEPEPSTTAAAEGPWDVPETEKEEPAAIREPTPAPPAETPPAPPEGIQQPEGPPPAVVLSPDKMGALIAWMIQNWFYVVSAVSLSLAGIFLVQYGIEKGLLPPWLRVTAAMGFGAALVAAGEFIRRRYGDSEDSSTAYLPSTFSSAGIVTLFGAVLAARALYGLIGPEMALAGMALVGAVALVLGWFYGPLLAAIGVIGAMAAPFVVGGSTDNPSWLFSYFAIVALVGLAIDTVQRWAWVSVISLTLGYGAGFLLMIGAPRLTEAHFIIFCALLALAAIAIPVRRLMRPDHGGTPLSMSFLARQKKEPWPEFPTRLAGGAILAASILILVTSFETRHPDVFWTAVVILTGLVLALLIWARNAPALADQIAVPAIALVAAIAGGWRIWAPEALAATEPEADMPLMVTILIAIGLLVSAVAGWRSLSRNAARHFTAAGAAIFAPALAIAIEVVWQPANAIGTYAWALHAMAIAALMVGMAERFARADGPDDRLRVSLAALSALSSVAFGLVLLFSSAALTTALAVTIVAAAWLDRQFNLPLMGLYILAGISTVGYRLIIDPGLDWATDAPWAEMLLSHGGAVLAFAVSWWLARSAHRPRTEVLLESAVFSSAGILLSLVLFRTIQEWGGWSATESHWSFGLGATVWIVLGLAQVRRLAIGGALRTLRLVLAWIFLLIGAAQLALAALLFNPLFDDFRSDVIGPPLLNTLVPAYLLPAIVLALGARWLKDARPALRIGLNAVAVALATLWLGLTIRHFWRGAEGMGLPGIEQPELYSYTVALLTVGAVLFYRSLAKNSPLLRKAGLLVIGLAVAKVFLIDISGLGGLIRVFSLLLLGLSLAALAWLNRWAVGQGAPTNDPES
ncbi:MAG: DUF2339 domain-containing protein [Alphaproteobacteria bacterium]|nr:DUF2339 domain-containing protein [Alphaproteobacteria bacterium]